MAKLSEKIDDLKATKSAVSDDEGKDNISVRMSKQLKRDLEWWKVVPERHNGAPIFKAVETAYLHCNSSGYG